MTEDYRNSSIGELFSQADKELEAADFLAGVMVGIDRMKRRARVKRLLIALVLAAGLFSLQGAVVPLSQSLIAPLLELDGLVGLVLAPINSLAGLLSIGLLGLRAAHKRFSA